jgi:hypothetical protein
MNKSYELVLYPINSQQNFLSILLLDLKVPSFFYKKTFFALKYIIT